jgi:hypothetical protein
MVTWGSPHFAGELGPVPPGRCVLRSLRRLRRGAGRGRALRDPLEPSQHGAEPVDLGGPGRGTRLEPCGAVVGGILSHKLLGIWQG